MGRLDGKVALVTGAAQGIGKAIAETFASEGASIAVCDFNPDKARETAAELSYVAKSAAYPMNVSQQASVDEAVAAVLKDFGKIDILVNNAGITRDNLLIRMKREDWDAVLAVNLTGAFTVSQAVIRTMMKARYGRIVNMASVVGVTGNAGQANYSASKAGLIGLTKTMAKEFASRNITVNAIAPGFIATQMTDVLPEEAKQAFLRNIPLARPGTPADVAKVALFLASDDAEYVTGQVICVDGGMVM
jgi:3-oxoacyl-[acyl-carrier protein] reductase